MKKQLMTTVAADYHWAISKWPKAAGNVPNDLLLATVQALGIRAGCKHAIACAMYLRDEGATDPEVIAVAMKHPNQQGRRQGVLHNYALDKKIGLCGIVGFAARDMGAGHRDGHKVIKITLTKKGEAARDKWLAANPLPAAPVAPVAKAKPQRKAKAKPVSEPVSEPVSDSSVLIPAAPVSDAVDQLQG